MGVYIQALKFHRVWLGRLLFRPKFLMIVVAMSMTLFAHDLLTTISSKEPSHQDLLTNVSFVCQELEYLTLVRCRGLQMLNINLY